MLAPTASIHTYFEVPRRLVRPGGLLVVELPHPEELFSGAYYTPSQFVDAWDASAGDKSVLVEWGREGDEFDAQTQVRGVGIDQQSSLGSGVLELKGRRARASERNYKLAGCRRGAGQTVA